MGETNSGSADRLRESAVSVDPNTKNEAERDEPRKRSLLAAAADGVYIPPAKRRQLELERQQQQQSSTVPPDDVQVQKQTWEEQKRVIHGTINRLNATTMKPLIHELFEKVNLIRFRGVLAKSILLASVSAPRYADVYAALVAVLNTKLPEVGELVVKRAILAFRRHYRRKEKSNCVAMVILLGHLFHQSVVHELIILQILTVLLDGNPTDDSVEVAVQLLTTTGYTLLEVTPAGVRAVLERLRALLHEGGLNKRVEYKMEKLLEMRRNGFQDNTPIPEELDLVESDDQITFEISLDDEDIQKEEHLDVFSLDPEYTQHEEEWSKIRAEILGLGGDDSDDDDDDGEGETDDDEDDSEEEEEEEVTTQAVVPAATGSVVVKDLTEADLVHLRRSIYLTIMSSATFEECAHKLAKIDIPPGREEELINMLIECCSQERTFLRYYGLIAARFCLMDDRWRDAFMDTFAQQYSTIHRLETNKLRNVAKLFAHLLHSDSLPWNVLSVIHINEDETTSSSRIFIKILIQEITEAKGIAKVKARFETEDEEQKEWYKGMFPRDNVRNTRYAINFFTSIGLGPLTDGLREFLKNAPKLIMAQAQQNALEKKDDDSSSVSSSSSPSSSSSTTSSSYGSSSLSSSSDSSGSSSTTSSYYRRRKFRRRRRRSRSSSYSSDYSSPSRSCSRGSRRKYRNRSKSPPRRRRGKDADRSRSRSPRSDDDSVDSGRRRRGRGRSSEDSKGNSGSIRKRQDNSDRKEDSRENSLRKDPPGHRQSPGPIRNND